MIIMAEFKRIAKFYKVSKEQYLKSFDNKNNEEILSIYDDILLPKRATKGSAGYDFFAPFDIVLKPGETIKVPTGIRVSMELLILIIIIQIMKVISLQK